MSIDSGKWNNEKRIIADELGEITSIWNCGVKNRNIAISNGINSWQDPLCNSKNIGITNSNSSIIDKILDINRQEIDLIRPAKIKNNIYDWKNKCKNELFIDFETLTNLFNEDIKTERIFLIGVGWYDNEIWSYKSFKCEKNTHKEEYRILEEFTNFLKNKNNPKLYYWSAENTIWNNARKRHNFKVPNLENMCDLLKIFRSEPIVIKGCFKFGLKSVAEAMLKHNMITVENDNNCKSGMNAMIQASQYYKLENSSDSSIMNDIETYNEFDCKVLWDIISYLRKNHI
jgi:predicted RecB family nuclease